MVAVVETETTFKELTDMADLIMDDIGNGITDEFSEVNEMWAECFADLIIEENNLLELAWEDSVSYRDSKTPYAESCHIVVDVTTAVAIPKEVAFKAQVHIGEDRRGYEHEAVGMITVELASVVWEDGKQLASFDLANYDNYLEVV